METDEARRERIGHQGSAFSRHLGSRTTHVSADRIEGEMTVSPDLLNRNGLLHGGAVMGMADILGGSAASVNIADDEMTTTTESKTNFFRSVAAGEVVRGVCLPLHRGRRTQVWQTSLYRQDGKLVAQVTQTQMTLPRAGSRE